MSMVVSLHILREAGRFRAWSVRPCQAAAVSTTDSELTHTHFIQQNIKLITSFQLFYNEMFWQFGFCLLGRNNEATSCEVSRPGYAVLVLDLVFNLQLSSSFWSSSSSLITAGATPFFSPVECWLNHLFVTNPLTCWMLIAGSQLLLALSIWQFEIEPELYDSEERYHKDNANLQPVFPAANDSSHKSLSIDIQTGKTVLLSRSVNSKFLTDCRRLREFIKIYFEQIEHIEAVIAGIFQTSSPSIEEDTSTHFSS